MMQRIPRWADSCRLLTIYDLAVEARWTGKIGDEEVTGTLRVPEVSHEAIDGLSDYEVGTRYESCEAHLTVVPLLHVGRVSIGRNAARSRQEGVPGYPDRQIQLAPPSTARGARCTVFGGCNARRIRRIDSGLLASPARQDGRGQKAGDGGQEGDEDLGYEDCRGGGRAAG